MKKVLILISFLFVTVCYAAPPPEPVPIAADEVAFVVDQLQVVDVAVYTIEALEVAYVYLGDTEVWTGTVVSDEAAMKIEAAKLPEVLNTTNLIALNKPPALLIDDNGGYNTKAFLNDQQHSNYGYPFTAY